MKKRLSISMLVIFFTVGILATFARAEDVPRMTKDGLKARLNDPDLVILDVRSQSDWKDGDSKIKGAIREDPESVISWAEKYSKDKTFALY